jgi:hypothetical protein
MPKLKMNEMLTQPDPAAAQRHLATYAGQAFFAGTGPAGRTCGQCMRWLFHGFDKWGFANSSKCSKTEEMSPRHAVPVPYAAGACKYFEENPSPPAASAKW